MDNDFDWNIVNYKQDITFQLNKALVGNEKYYDKYVLLTNTTLHREIIVHCISVKIYKEIYGLTHERLQTTEIVINKWHEKMLIIDNNDNIKLNIIPKDKLPIISSCKISGINDAKCWIDGCYIDTGYVFSNLSSLYTIAGKNFVIREGTGIYKHNNEERVTDIINKYHDDVIERKRNTDARNKTLQLLQMDKQLMSIDNILKSANVNENDKTKYEPETIINNVAETQNGKLYVNFKELGIGGMNEQLDTITQSLLLPRILPKEITDKFCMKHMKGAILVGPPGTGKTLLARNIGKLFPGSITELIKGPEMLSKFIGSSEQNIRIIFEKSIAAWEKEIKEGIKSDLHIIIFDEIDSIGSERTGGSGNDYKNSVLTQLLAMIDGLKTQNNLLIFGTTNREDLLDPALIRAGRLEFLIRMDVPTANERRDIFDVYFKQLRNNGILDDGVDEEFMNYLINATDGYTGADIESLVTAAKNLVIPSLFVRTENHLEIVNDVVNNVPKIKRDHLLKILTDE